MLGSRKWDVRRVQEVRGREIIEIIISMPEPREDKLMWMGSEIREYSVESAARIIAKAFFDPVEKCWGNFCKLKIHEVQAFVIEA